LDDLIIRALQGRTTDEEVERLRSWREASPDHEEHYQRFAAVWRATRDYQRRLRPSEPPIDATLARIRTHGSGRRRRGRSFLTHAAAAAAALVVGVVAVTQTDRAAPIEQMSEFVTGAGETATVRLNDGTIVRLAPETRLVLTGAAAGRDVTLEGRAFFAVVKDPAQPFRVHTPAGLVRVHGTRFELQARREDLRVVVVEGRVGVATNGGEVEVVDRQVSHARRGEPPSVVEVAEVWSLLHWLGGFLAFESTPMTEVAEEIEHRLGVRLVIEDVAIARQTVTAWFGNEPIEEIVAVLCRLVEARCVMEGNVFRMYSRNGVPTSDRLGDARSPATSTAMEEGIR
jgi:transmembrane sensor